MDRRLTCLNCKSYLGTAHGSIVATLLCAKSGCKMENQIKIVNTDVVADLKYKFTKPQTLPKKESKQ